MTDPRFQAGSVKEPGTLYLPDSKKMIQSRIEAYQKETELCRPNLQQSLRPRSLLKCLKIMLVIN